MSFFDRWCNITDNFNVTVDDVVKAVTVQKKGKAIGLDQIIMEAFIFNTHRLLHYITMLFNAYLRHYYTYHLHLCNYLLFLLSKLRVEI